MRQSVLSYSYIECKYPLYSASLLSRVLCVCVVIELTGSLIIYGASLVVFRMRWWNGTWGPTRVWATPTSIVPSVRVPTATLVLACALIPSPCSWLVITCGQFGPRSSLPVSLWASPPVLWLWRWCTKSGWLWLEAMPDKCVFVQCTATVTVMSFWLYLLYRNQHNYCTRVGGVCDLAISFGAETGCLLRLFGPASGVWKEHIGGEWENHLVTAIKP